eukprot:COSAG05_NODE_2457_length_3038_cov_4.874107_3_plen_55_part_00
MVSKLRIIFKRTLGIFRAIDRDDSGELDQREFKMGLNRLGLGLTGEQLTLLVQV